MEMIKYNDLVFILSLQRHLNCSQFSLTDDKKNLDLDFVNKTHNLSLISCQKSHSHDEKKNSILKLHKQKT